MKDLLSKRVLNAWRWAILLLPVLALGQASAQKPKIICDHAAPPRGMHYVCKSQCDCHLEGKLQNDDNALDSAEPPKQSSYECQPLMTRVFAPLYPPIARTNRIAGKVFVQVEVSADGSVTNASVVEGHPLLRKTALKAARQWRFNPKC